MMTRSGKDVVSLGALDRAVVGIFFSIMLGVNGWALLEIINLKERVARIEGHLAIDAPIAAISR